MCTKGRKSGSWSKIPVPSNWELQGFGTFNYYQDTQNPDEQGLYKYRFTVAPQHGGKKIFIVFDGAMTDAEIKINGQTAGPIHQGGFYQFKYDITALIQFGKPNLLEATISKHSSNNSINRAERKADFWLFGGLFRPVYLEIMPQTRIERVAIDAQANGVFNLQVFANTSVRQTIEAQVCQLNGKPVEGAFSLRVGDSVLHHQFNHHRLWNPEEPNLYYVSVYLKEGNKIIHTIKQRFGFRTAELRKQDGFYVNGKKVIFKGVCRHSEWPESGRTLSRQVHLMDIKAIKDMNMNAVRMSHYPPDKEFLDLCDSLGLFVLDELTGWQAAYDTTVGRKLVKELVVRDVNHPSVVIWDNGNEGGWNRALDNDYALYDPQKRLVIHPWERFNGTNTKHYPDFKYIQNEVANPKEVFFPTEFMHGLFDGGHGAALEDFWNEMMKHPYAAGGFLWSLHDEGVKRSDRHNSIDVAGNMAPDGIVGPYREKEGSFYTIKELWSPVYIDSKVPFANQLSIENRYLYTNLSQLSFEWRTVHYPSAKESVTKSSSLQKGVLKPLLLAPGEKGFLSIPINNDHAADAVCLVALTNKRDTVCSWSWALQPPSQYLHNLTNPSKKPGLTIKEDARVLIVICDGINYTFDKQTGFLQKVFNGTKPVSFGAGPSLAGSKQVLHQFTSINHGSQYLVTPTYDGDSIQVKWIFESGKLPRLDYSYMVKDTADFMGIGFSYPEEKITGMKWLGRGPYRVWKNRLKGQQFGVWQKAYNNTINGESWIYPEFKGWHSELYWIQLQNTEANFIVYTDQPDIYLQMLKPVKPKAAGNNNTSPAFPETNIGFMHGISAIGTKFQSAELMGPQSRRNVQNRNHFFMGTLYFDFR